MANPITALPLGWPQGYGRAVFDSLPSTNAAALAADGPAWIAAQTQTAGRGRRARAWDSPRGNLYASLILHPSDPPTRMALRSFAAALALRDALIAAGVAGDQITLKWPNDVLLAGGKVAGILLESAPRGALACLAIGFGVNLAAHPDASGVEAGATTPTSVLAATGRAVQPVDFLTHLAAAYAQREAQFIAHGFAPIRKDFLAHAARLGDQITARLASGIQHMGTFSNIDQDGNLILQTAAGPMAIPAADVFF
ncbi:MAG: biotin--[acetyl-CoA-carboxylase] ligase [Cypionkella sp.]|nr:biotin--[acetyl-CoA-carboxylase] ligase [Cypionkella sp.]